MPFPLGDQPEKVVFLNVRVMFLPWGQQLLQTSIFMSMKIQTLIWKPVPNVSPCLSMSSESFASSAGLVSTVFLHVWLRQSFIGFFCIPARLCKVFLDLYILPCCSKTWEQDLSCGHRTYTVAATDVLLQDLRSGLQT